MVKGRRVRPVLACSAPLDCGPKRKNLRLEAKGKVVGHFAVSEKNHTITRFFETCLEQADVPLPKTISTPTKVPVIGSLPKLAQGQDEELKSPVRLGLPSTPTTPHRIELVDPKPKPKPKAENGVTNHKLTEFFQVRRSVRKTKRTVLEERQQHLEQLLRKRAEEGLEVRVFKDKGRGVVASREFDKGDFVVEYSGELIDLNQAKRREEKYANNESTGCYMYYFKHQNHQYCIDATAESGRLGRLVNHSRNGNLLTRTIFVDGIPRLVLIAKQPIQAGEEVTYDYGDRSKESLKYHPWLAF